MHTNNFKNVKARLQFSGFELAAISQAKKLTNITRRKQGGLQEVNTNKHRMFYKYLNPTSFSSHSLLPVKIKYISQGENKEDGMR